jgi:hypothetical protein
MERKPDIQYIGQFYVHGSEARELARQEQAKRAKTQLPLFRQQRIRKIAVDPVAVTGIAVAVMMMVVMIVGAISIHNAWMQHDRMAAYVKELTAENTALEQEYRAGYDPEDIREKAVALGMIPAAEAQSILIYVRVPQVEKDPTWWEDMVWFLDGMIE